jgi:hypothetical protein
LPLAWLISSFQSQKPDGLAGRISVVLVEGEIPAHSPVISKMYGPVRRLKPVITTV